MAPHAMQPVDRLILGNGAASLGNMAEYPGKAPENSGMPSAAAVR